MDTSHTLGRMDRRGFVRLGGVSVLGAAILPGFLARAGVFPAGTTLADLTFRLQVATADDFAPPSLVFDAAGLEDPFQSVGGLRGGTTFSWRVNATDGAVTSPWSETSHFRTGTTVGTGDAPALRFELGRSYPNPARGAVRIPFSLPARGHVTLEVVNLLGQRVATVLDEDRAPGRHEVAWEVAGLAAGTYVVTLRTPTDRATQRLVVVH